MNKKFLVVNYYLLFHTEHENIKYITYKKYVKLFVQKFLMQSGLWHLRIGYGQIVFKYSSNEILFLYSQFFKHVFSFFV